MALVLALVAAVTYGAADFVGGAVSKRAGAIRSVLLSQAVGSLLTVLLLPVLGSGSPSRDALWWGAAAGIGGGTGVLLLYRGLAIGRMSVVAPITGVEAAGVPVVFALAVGERPSPLALGGVVLGLVAVALVSSTSEASEAGQRRTAGLAEALGAGLSFGLFFICLDQASDGAGLWPLIGARASSLLLIVCVAVAARIAPRPPVGTGKAMVAAGLLDVAANISYLLATQRGLLSLTAVVTSMYPGATVLLARMVLKERLARVQLVGLAVAGAAVILIGLG